MILPAKHLPQERALLTIGAQILKILDRPKSVSLLWNELGKSDTYQAQPITFDWFILALDLLAIINVIHLENDRISRTNP